MKSSFSNPSGSCVDAEKDEDGNVIVTHSKTKDLKHSVYITYTAGEWIAFIAGVKNDEFELGKLPVRKQDREQ
jgi:hypothetical protein